MPGKVQPLQPDNLRWTCDPGRFTFETTADIPSVDEVVGQERALHSLDFGLDFKSQGFNIYVLGSSGTGKASIVRARLEKRATGEEAPDDWCYVFNFSDPDRPKALSLPAGMGSKFKMDMEKLVNALIRDIPKVFESKEYENHRDEIYEGQQERSKVFLHRMEQQAQVRGFILKRSASGLSVLPAKDGKPLSQEAFEALTKEEKARIETDNRFLQDKLADTIREIRTIEKETKERIRVLDREVVQYVVTPLINELLEAFREFPKIIDYIQLVQEDILEHIDDFRPKEEPPLMLPGLKLPKVEVSFERYSINLIVNNEDAQGSPVVVEPNPTYYNLFGRIEHRVQYGVAVTDFTMIKAGSIHRANGGYLVINALDLLRNIFSYDALKRMIKTREVKIEDVWEQYRLVSTTTLKPESIPVDIKVILIGEPYIYYILYNMDAEYKKLFKVKADFDERMPMTKETIDLYTSFIAARCREEELLPFDRTGVARVIEYASRIAEHQEKLTAKFGKIADLLRESSYWASVEKSNFVTSETVEEAIREKIYRNSRIEDRIRELIREGTFLIDTKGKVVGQINGIAVIDLGDYSFGKVARITARTYLGDSGVVNIEREVKMSGRIHNKALMILTSYLGEKFARDIPVSLSAYICFEQLYEEVEGDSATCTEFYALVSSLSNLPLSQGIAVTGSMNQLGEVQPVGGINEKIEGFFDLCAAKGFSGGEGVIIPKKNVRNLMLKIEAVEAVRDGLFSIYPIEHVDQGIEILTGVPAGEIQADGKYPEGAVNFLVAEKLHYLARTLKAFGKGKGTAARTEEDKQE